MDFHFNALLDAVGEWRKGKSPNEDVNLHSKLMEMHKAFKEDTQLNFSDVCLSKSEEFIEDNKLRCFESKQIYFYLHASAVICHAVWQRM